MSKNRMKIKQTKKKQLFQCNMIKNEIIINKRQKKKSKINK